MPDDLTPHYHRLTHAAALVGEFEGRPERQAELLAWVLEAVRAIAAARGLALETGPEPLPPHISRGFETWAQSNAVEFAAAEVERQERAERPEPLPQHISRDLWPAQGEGSGDDATWQPAVAQAWVASRAIRPALSESEDPDLGLIDAGMQWPQPARTIIEAGAGFAPGEFRRPDACDPAEDGVERVMQAAESWWGQRG